MVLHDWIGDPEYHKTTQSAWYLWGFIGITVFTSLVDVSPGLLGAMDTAGKVILTIAMAAIGLKVSFKALYRSGRKGLGFGLMIFVVQLLLVAGLMGVSGAM